MEEIREETEDVEGTEEEARVFFMEKGVKLSEILSQRRDLMKKEDLKK